MPLVYKISKHRWETHATVADTVACLQDLTGFDENIKAVHGTPSKRGVSFGHSISMPAPKSQADGQAWPRRLLNRTSTRAGTPGEGLLARRSTPSVQVDSSAGFSGFQTLRSAEVSTIRSLLQPESRDLAIDIEPCSSQSLLVDWLYRADI